MITRRKFLEATASGSTLLAFGAAVPSFLTRTARATSARRSERDTVLVVIQLSGGNDGLNTVVPYEDAAYQRARPTLRLTGSQVHKLEAGLGLHPDMAAFHRLYHEGHLAIIQGVGYPKSNRDHEGAMRDWHTARPVRAGRSGRTSELSEPETEAEQTGWLGRACDRVYESAAADVPGVFVGNIKAPFSLQSERVQIPSVRTLDQWLLSPRSSSIPGAFGERLAQLVQAKEGNPGPALLDFLRQTSLDACTSSQRVAAVGEAGHAGEYPPLPLARTLGSIAQLIRADLGIRIYFAELGGGGIGGFDTHAGQAANHGALLRELSASVAAFVADLQHDKLLGSVLVMTFSEFGRTLEENGRRGTGHGAAAPMFLAGGKLKGGLVGAHPSLTDLDGDSPRFHTDFRRVYATVLESWLGFDSRAILGESFEALELLV